jgi:hypothetical protein
MKTIVSYMAVIYAGSKYYGEASVLFEELLVPDDSDENYTHAKVLIQRWYQALELPDKNMFYYDFLSRPFIIKLVLAEVLRIGDNPEEYISNLSFLLRCVSPVVPQYALSACDLMLAEIPHLKPKRDRGWGPEVATLQLVSRKADTTEFVKMVATFYSYGYILPADIIARTYLLGTGASIPTDADVSTLDLDTGLWHTTINIYICPDLCIYIRSRLAERARWDRWRLTPDIDATTDLMSHTAWQAAGLASQKYYRRVYLAWLTRNMPDDLARVKGIIDLECPMTCYWHLPGPNSTMRSTRRRTPPATISATGAPVTPATSTAPPDKTVPLSQSPPMPPPPPRVSALQQLARMPRGTSL